MAPTGQAPWAACLVALLASGMPTATSLTVSERTPPYDLDRDASRNRSYTSPATATPTPPTPPPRRAAMLSVPSSVAGLWFHLSSSSLAATYSDGDRVHTWPAADGSGKDVIAHDASEDVTFRDPGVISGRPAVQFTDKHKLCTSGSYPVIQELTVFWKGSFEWSLRRNWAHLVGQGHDQYWVLRRYDSSSSVTMHTRNANAPNTGMEWDIPILIIGTVTGGTRTIQVYRASDKHLISSNTVSDVNTIPSGNEPICIGDTQFCHDGRHAWGNICLFRGEVEEMLVYDRLLSTSERSSVVNYLSTTPTPVPTPSPTPSPTSSPTFSPTAPVYAAGDPHLENIYGERFDLMKPGNVVLVQIPLGQPADDALLTVEAYAKRMGASCADIYFQALNITGAWADEVQAGGFTFTARDEAFQTPTWMKLGPLELKVVRGQTYQGLQYLNLYVKHLNHAGVAVGGLLGEGDHTDAATPAGECLKTMALSKAHDA